MRQFVVVAHDAPTTPDFDLDGLPGAGRVDLLARSVVDALLTSHGIRDDVRVHVVLDDAYTVRFDGASLRNLHPDERSAAALLRSALEAREEAIGHQPAEVSPGVSIVRFGLEDTLDVVADGGSLLSLVPGGQPAPEVDRPDDPAFVLSDHRPLTEAEGNLVDERADAAVSLGPEAVHTTQAIAVAHNWLDTGGFRRY